MAFARVLAISTETIRGRDKYTRKTRTLRWQLGSRSLKYQLLLYYAKRERCRRFLYQVVSTLHPTKVLAIIPVNRKNRSVNQVRQE